MGSAPTVFLEGPRAEAYCALVTQLLEASRPGVHFGDPRALKHLLWGLARPWPRQPQARAEVLAASGWPTLRQLERLGLLRSTAVNFLEAHGAQPSPDARAPLTALAGSALPERGSTVARLVSKAKGGRRFQVIHEHYAGALGIPVRFTFHLTDQKSRYLQPAADGTAVVSKKLEEALELSCEGSAEEALWGLSSLDGTQVGEVVMGQLGPVEVPGFVAAPGLPLEKFLAAAGEGAGALHLVVERAAEDVAEDRCRDPFATLPQGGHHERRRQSLGYRVSRERRLACTPAIDAALTAHLASLGQPLVVRSR